MQSGRETRSSLPRRSRSIQPGTTYHLIARFVANEWFIRTDVERRQYLELFGRAVIASDWRCLAFAIMSSHVHFALTAGFDPLASWLREAHGPFAEWINGRHERIGAVFVRGPKTIGVRLDGLPQLVGYIHRNPVRAGVVERARESTWTSHRAYLEPERAPAWLDVHRGLELMGFTEPRALDTWVDATRIERAELDAVRLEPVKRGGRPRTANAAEVGGLVRLEPVNRRARPWMNDRARGSLSTLAVGASIDIGRQR